MALQRDRQHRHSKVRRAIHEHVAPLGAAAIAPGICMGLDGEERTIKYNLPEPHPPGFALEVTRLSCKAVMLEVVLGHRMVRQEVQRAEAMQHSVVAVRGEAEVVVDRPVIEPQRGQE